MPSPIRSTRTSSSPPRWRSVSLSPPRWSSAATRPAESAQALSFARFAGIEVVVWSEGSTSERVRRLQSVTDAALAHLRLDELLNALLERTRQILEVDTCAILLLDEDTNELVARAAIGIEEEVEQGVRIPVGGGFAGRGAAERQPVVLPDVDHAHVLNPILREKGIKSMLGVPLMVGSDALGVIHVGTLVHRRFT